MSYGVPKDVAIKKAVEAKTNPKRAVTSLVNALSKTDWAYDKSPKEIYAEAEKLSGSDAGDAIIPQTNETRPVGGAQQAPPEAIKMLMKDPSLAPQFKAKYGYIPSQR